MQINPIKNYNQQIYNTQPHKTMTFNGFKAYAELNDIFSTPNDAIPFVEKIKEYQAESINLRELINVDKLTNTGKIILKKWFSLLGEEKVQDFPIIMSISTPDAFHTVTYPRYYADCPILKKDGKIELDATRIYVNDNGKRMVIDGAYGKHIEIDPSVANVKKEIGESLTKKINYWSEELDKLEAEEQKTKGFEALQKDMESVSPKRNIVKEINVPAEDLLPVASVVCTIEDINNYLINHLTEIDEGRIFNKPVTKDGESLLIGLVHAQPNRENIDKYISLAKNMGKMPFINYNQKDAMNIPAIAHVLNSQNKILFAAFTNSKDLKYEPSLEFEFGNITDPEFKELVLNSRIFENKQNTEFKTIFGQPNPMYRG